MTLSFKKICPVIDFVYGLTIHGDLYCWGYAIPEWEDLVTQTHYQFHVTPSKFDGKYSDIYKYYGHLIAIQDNGVICISNVKKLSQLKDMNFYDKKIQGSIENSKSVLKELFKELGIEKPKEEGELDDDKYSFLHKIIKDNKSLFQTIAAGSNYFFAVDKEENVWACGANYCGQLGLGDIKDREDPVKTGWKYKY